MQINVTIIQDGKQAIARSFETMEAAADYLNEMAGRDIAKELEKEPMEKVVYCCADDEISPTQSPKPSFIKRLFNV